MFPVTRQEKYPGVEGASSWGPEMVFAIVTPIGTPDTRFRNELEGGLHAYGYTTEWIKLSQLLKDQAQKHGKLVRSSPEHLRASDLMDVGDFLCEEAGSAAAVALHGVNEIRKRRAEYKSPDRPDFTGPVLAIPRRAWILDSVKRPAEVKHLRRIYGDHLIVIGIQAGPTTRTNRINELIEPHAVSMGEAELHDIVSRLVSRDLDEAGKGVFGQNILKTFPMADVFIDVDGDVGHQVGRLLDLLFGNPDYPVPTDDEYGMHLAFVASTRSPELGLKVGAAIMRGSTVVSLGVNAHPTSGTDSPAYDRSAVDIRKLVLDTLRQLSTSELNEQAIQRLNEDADEYVRYLLQGPLAGAGINQLTEFQLTVHAEMAALLDAVQHGKSIDNATVYVTAYPCHDCTKHLLRLDLPVRYIEPYPKSRAQAMYGQNVTDSFQPFTGVAPRRYHLLFTTTEDRKSPEGVRKSWSDHEKKQADPNVDPLLDHSGITVREEFAVSQLPSTDVTTSDR